MQLTQFNQDQTFKLYADCIPVKGAARSAIYDLTRKKIIKFPSAYFDLIELVNGKCLSSLADHPVMIKNAQQVGDFLQYLLTNEVGVFLDSPENFPAIAGVWEEPAHIQNAIIDVDAKLHDWQRCFSELDRVGCIYVQVRSYSNLLSLKELELLAQCATNTSIKGVELLLKHDPALDLDALMDYFKTNLVIARIVIHSSPQEESRDAWFSEEFTEDYSPKRTIQLITKAIKSNADCGVINQKSLSLPSVPIFFENKHFNGCLNKKISIDVDGAIKNCPSMKASFGHIDTHSLSGVFRLNEFNQVWDMSKDKIEVCKDCEMRYACSDCRVFIADPANPYSKPAKCSYDPYIGKWAD